MSCGEGKLILSYYRWLQNGLTPDKIDVSLLTHLILGFCVVEDDGTIGDGETGGEESYQATVLLKTTRPDLKVLVSVGGGGNHSGFRRMVRDDDLVQSFVASAASMIERYGFDGLDLDWEFPQGSTEKARFVFLLEKLREAFDKHPMKPLLTIAVPAQLPLVNRGYDVPKISQIVDLVLLMSYDLHMYKWYLPFTGYNAPLLPRKREFSYFRTLNIRFSAKLWNKRGVPKEKLVVGLPTYGLTWKLLWKGFKGPWSPAIGCGPHGGYTSYPKVVHMLSAGSGQPYWDKRSHSPYVITKDKLWISYDNETSIRAKVKFIKELDCAGVMCFSLNCDDWSGECGTETFPLHRTIYSELIQTNKL